MAIYHCSVKPIQRSAGRSATAAAAYRAAARIVDDRTGAIHDYTRKQGVEHTEIVTPTGEAIDRAELWNLAEAAEKRKDGTTAREYQIALPDELTVGQQQELVRAFAEHLAERHGCAVDVAIHAPNREGDQRNHHAHLLTTTRRLENGQLGAKCDVELKDSDRAKKGLAGRKEELETTRAAWADMVNIALARAGHETRVSHKSLEAQGIDRAPTVHLGAAASLERRGVQTDRGDINRQRAAAHAAMQEIKAELEELELEAKAELEELDASLQIAADERPAAAKPTPDKTPEIQASHSIQAHSQGTANPEIAGAGNEPGQTVEDAPSKPVEARSPDGVAQSQAQAVEAPAPAPDAQTAEEIKAEYHKAKAELNKADAEIKAIMARGDFCEDAANRERAAYKALQEIKAKMEPQELEELELRERKKAEQEVIRQKAQQYRAEREAKRQQKAEQEAQQQKAQQQKNQSKGMSR